MRLNLKNKNKKVSKVNGVLRIEFMIFIKQNPNQCKLSNISTVLILNAINLIKTDKFPFHYRIISKLNNIYKFLFISVKKVVKIQN